MEGQGKELIDSSSNSRIIGPLKFSKDTVGPKDQLYPSTILVPCLFCSKNFTFNSEKHDYLAHLYLCHHLIIGDEDQIAILHEYLTLWHKIFSEEEQPLNEYCSTLIMNNNQYYLLCDVSVKDHEIRQQLREKRLNLALAQHQFERTDNSFERDCLFCRDIIKTSRYAFIEHLYNKHFLQLGMPENLVFIDDLISTVELNLNELKCIFCEKTFKDRSVLKEHMRKKGHKRINPDNRNYDRFFLINYRNEPQKNSCEAKAKQTKRHGNKEMADISEDEDDCNWSDWVDDEMDITCLFCERKSKNFTNLQEHIKTNHGIDFEEESKELSFYDKVKVINFVRRKMYKMECIKCGIECESIDQLREHLKINKHYSLGEKKDWNQPQYFFPTYEDDAFLQHLDDFVEPDISADNAIKDPSSYSEHDSNTSDSCADAISKLNIL